jgi:hypothetical protein
MLNIEMYMNVLENLENRSNRSFYHGSKIYIYSNICIAIRSHTLSIRLGLYSEGSRKTARKVTLKLVKQNADEIKSVVLQLDAHKVAI